MLLKENRTLLGLHGNIPAFIRITSGKVHDVNILDQILPEAGAFYVMDRGYVDFERPMRSRSRHLSLLCARSRTCCLSGATRIRRTTVPACAPIRP